METKRVNNRASEAATQGALARVGTVNPVLGVTTRVAQQSHLFRGTNFAAQSVAVAALNPINDCAGSRDLKDEQ